MKQVLEYLNIDVKLGDLAREGLELILNECNGDIDMDLSLEQLAYVGIGKYLAERNKSYRKEKTQVTMKEKIYDIKINSSKEIGLKKNVYAGGGSEGAIDSVKSERIKVIINGKEEKEFLIHRELIYRKSKKPVKSASGYDLIVIKGKTDAGVWRAKDVNPHDNKWFMKAWGSTNKRRKRHKFSESEAKDVSHKINREVIYDSTTKNWEYILENDKIDLIYAWLALWNQHPFN